MTDVAELLGQITQGYARAHPESLPAELGTAWGGTRRAQPGSRPPPGSSSYVRGQLVEAARLVLDIQWKAGGPQRPQWSGFGARNVGFRAGIYQDHAHEPDGPEQTAHRYDARVSERERECAVCKGETTDARGELCKACDGAGTYVQYGDELRVVWRPIWAPASDDIILTPPTPTDMRGACRAAQGRVSAVWDPDVAHVVAQLVHAAMFAVALAGGDEEGARRIQWRNIQALQDKVCSRCGEETKPGQRVHGRCKKCANAVYYQERKRGRQAASS